ncbi:MAG: DUF5333 domain-containing protein [Pseudomonadota bacterium]
MIRLLIAVLLITSPLSAPVAARSPGDVAEVRNGLLAVAAGDMIQRNCGEISPRLIRVYSLRNRLVSAALAAGFSAEEIENFVDDEVALANLRAEAARYLTQRGVETGVPDTYCTVGAAEITANTPVGRLLRK